VVSKEVKLDLTIRLHCIWWGAVGDTGPQRLRTAALHQQNWNTASRARSCRKKYFGYSKQIWQFG